MVLSSIIWIVLLALEVIGVLATRVLFSGPGWRIVLGIGMGPCGMVLGCIIPRGLHGILVRYPDSIASGYLPVLRWTVPGIVWATTIETGDLLHVGLLVSVVGCLGL